MRPFYIVKTVEFNSIVPLRSGHIQLTQRCGGPRLTDRQVAALRLNYRRVNAPLKKNAKFAGRSARRRIRYGNQ